jgi:hypothetical protein
MHRARPRAFVPLLPALPYVLSFLLPIDGQRGNLGDGFHLFVVGISAFPFWLPNPLMWLGLYLLDRGRSCAVLAVGSAAVALALLAIFMFEELIRAPAYIAWFVSMLLLVIAGYLAPVFLRPPDPLHASARALERELLVLSREVRSLRERADTDFFGLAVDREGQAR